VKICDVTQFYSPVSGGVKRYISEKRQHVLQHTRDEHHLIIPGGESRYTREGRLHLHTIRSPRLDFFSRYPSRYRLILNTKIVLGLLDDIRPDIIESGDPYHLAWSCMRRFLVSTTRIFRRRTYARRRSLAGHGFATR
jgi:alpha-1,6-mannosyltransferase